MGKPVLFWTLKASYGMVEVVRVTSMKHGSYFGSTLHDTGTRWRESESYGQFASEDEAIDAKAKYQEIKRKHDADIRRARATLADCIKRESEELDAYLADARRIKLDGKI